MFNKIILDYLNNIVLFYFSKEFKIWNYIYLLFKLIMQMLNQVQEDKKKPSYIISPQIFKELWDFFLKNFNNQ
jgi:hypothetical protein